MESSNIIQDSVTQQLGDIIYDCSCLKIEE